MVKIKKSKMREVEVLLDRNEVENYLKNIGTNHTNANTFELKELSIVLEDCLSIKRKLPGLCNILNKKGKYEDVQQNETKNSLASRCPNCLQFLDDNLVSLTVREDAVYETDILSDPNLNVDIGHGAVCYDETSKPEYKMVDFAVYDDEMHLCPFDSGLIQNGHVLYLSGCAKPIFSDDPSSEGGVYVSSIGPITEWWSWGYDGGSAVVIGISSEFADYYLVEPSASYAPFMESTKIKVYLSKLVIEFLEGNENGTYADLINKIQVHTPPEGYSNFTEENLIHHAQFIADHLLSYDQVADADENSLCQTKCMKTLIRLAGVTIRDRREITTSSPKTKNSRGLQKVVRLQPTESKATTTPLVRKVFETIFRDQIASEGRLSSKLVKCRGCKKSDCRSCKNGKKNNSRAQTSDSEVSDSDSEVSHSDIESASEVKTTKFTQLKEFDRSSIQVTWIGNKILTIGNKMFYNSAKVNGELIKVGDSVIVNPENPKSQLLLGKVMYMWEDLKNRGKSFHCHWFCHGSDTVLGSTAKKNLLFLIDECENVRLSDIKSKCTAVYKPPPSDWALLGGTEIENDRDEDDDCYFYSKWYQRSCARFEDPPNIYTDKGTNLKCNYCPCCEVEESARKKKMVEIGDEMDSDSQYTYYNSVSWNDVEYGVGDHLFLSPGSFKFKAKPYAPSKINWPVTEVDEEMYPEYYRKSKIAGKGHIQEPFCVGHVETIYCRSTGLSQLVEPKDVKIRIKKMYRPENTHEGVSASFHSDFNLLYWSNEEAVVDFSDVAGKCNVTYCEDESNDQFYENSNEHNFYFNKVYDAHSKTFEEPSSKLRRLGDRYKRINKDETGRPLRALDVFAGAGGLSEGLHQSKMCETLWAIEFVEVAAEAFQLNNPKCNVYNEDCNVLLKMIMEGKTVNAKGQTLPKKGDVEFLCGGPPCQGFSGMNRFTTGQYSQFKNSLIASYLSYCDYYRPKYFLLENVRNFLCFKENMVLKLSLQCLIEMGYQCTFGVLQAGNYGVPQSRSRAFILAAAPGEKLPSFPEPLHVFKSENKCSVVVNDFKYTINTQWIKSAPYRYVTVRDSLSDLPPIKNGAKIEKLPYCPKEQSHFQKLMRRNSKKDKIYDHICKEMKPLVVARMELIPCEPGSDWRDLPNTNFVLSDGNVTNTLIYRYNDAKHGRSKKGDLRGVCQCVEAKVFKKCDPLYRQPQDNTIIPWCLPHTANRHNNWAGLYGRLELDAHFKTTITNPEPMGKQGKVLHPTQHRVISVRECARSQGFPDSYKFCGSVLDRHKQQSDRYSHQQSCHLTTHHLSLDKQPWLWLQH
uniref:Cytosine-specific methyltransferase n=1 Tax=Strigamia maritima TaxID=126957 RepID=T1JNW9_STRMM